uniref:immunoglobulin-like domain-containing protein n=1 Tax=Clostridioides difficile TaxID=1496 RepID=UPI0031B5B5EF
MNNKKIISIFLSASILSSNLPYNVLADMKNSNNQIIYNENNSINKEAQNEGKEKSSESFSLDMGKYVDTNGILTFPEAKGIVDNPTYLRFDFNRNVYENVTITYSLNSVENTLIGKNIKIPVKNQDELNEVLKTLKVDTKGNKKLTFNILLGGLPIYQSVEGVPSRLYKAERAIDGNNDTFYGAINSNDSTFTILFKDKTYIENVLVKANKAFDVQGLQNGTWKNIGSSATSNGEIKGKKDIPVTKGEYDGIIVKQKHTSIDSCIINEIEFNEGSTEEKINYEANPCDLDLGNKVINKDGSVSFKDFKITGDEVKLLIKFKNDSDKNKISYTLNDQFIEKKGDCVIDVNSETESNEILKSLKIYHDNATENNVSISLIPSNNNLIEGVPDEVIAQGGAYDSIHTAENVFSGSDSHFISNLSNTLTLKNTKDIYITGVAFLNGNVQTTIKGLKDGKWTDIGAHSSSEFEMINITPGYYDEIKFVSNSTLDIRNLYLRYSNISKNIILDKNIFDLDMGEYKLDGDIITFPEAKGLTGGRTNLYISFNKEYSSLVRVKWQKDGKEMVESSKYVRIPIESQTDLNEVLKTLKIEDSNKAKLDFDIKLADIPTGAKATTNNFFNNDPAMPGGYKADYVMDDNLFTHYSSYMNEAYVQIDFIEDKNINSISIKQNKALGGRIQGNKDGKWIDIGSLEYKEVAEASATEYGEILNVDVIEGMYSGIRFYPEQLRGGMRGSRVCDIAINETVPQKFEVGKNKESNLSLGDSKIENNKITFPNAKGNIENTCKLIFKLNNIEEQNTSIRYNLNGKEIIKNNQDIEIEINTQEELDEVLKSLEIKFSELKGCSLDISMFENIEPYWGVPDGVVATGRAHDSSCTPQFAFKGSGNYWNSGSYNDSMYITGIDNIYLSAIKYYSKNNLRIRGKLQNDEWVTIGDTTANTNIRQLDVVEGYYKGLELYSYGYDWSHISDLEFLMNNRKVNTQINIEKSSLEIEKYLSDGSGNVTFPNFSSNINSNATLDIEIKKGYDEDLSIFYTLNGVNKTSKENKVSIPVSNNKELKEVLSSLKISHSNELDLNVSFLLNLKSGEKIEKDVDVFLDDSFDMGEMVNSDNKITFKNSKGRIKDKANLSILSKNDIQIKYTSNGKEIEKSGEKIILEDFTQEDLDEFLNSFSINYNVYEGCEFSISMIGNPKTIKYDFFIPQVQGELNLNLEESKANENGYTIFPGAKGLLCRKGSLNISFDEVFNNTIEIRYKLDNIEYVKKQNNLSIEVPTQRQLDEVLKTLKIRNFSNLDCDLSINLLEDRYVPVGTTSDKPECLNGQGWYCGRDGSTATITFKEPLRIGSLSVTKTGGTDNSFYIKGLKDGKWDNIGSYTVYPQYDNSTTREIDVQRNTYDAISINYSVENGWGSANVSKLGFLDKVSTNVKIEPSIELTASISDSLSSAKLKWKSDLKASAYNVYVKKKEDKNWTLSKNVTADERETEDYNINDLEAPIEPEHEIQLDTLKKGIQLSSTDLGTEYSYYVDAVDVNGEKIGTSNIEKINVQSDFKEFLYEVSDSSVAPTELKNKSNGFIPKRELVNKSFLYVASVDNAGNVSKTKAIPILKLFVDEAPVLKVGSNVDIKQNNKFDIMDGVTATDDIDGDLTKNIEVEITNPNGDNVPEIDTNILGYWKIKYSVKDSNNNNVSYTRTLRVVKNFNVELNLGKELVTSTFAKFPNARVLSEGKQQEINGLKMYFSQGFNKDKVKIHYVLNGVEKVSTEQKIELNNKFTIKEAEELIKSIKIEHDNSKEFKFTIKLNSNEIDDIIYNYENNHYYKFIEADNIDWNKAKEEAEKEEFLGHKGYLATVTSDQENIICNLFSATVFWIGGFFENNIWKWVSGENFSSYSNWMPGQPDRSNGETHLEFYNKQWNDFDSFNSERYPEGRPQGYLVEFGLNEKLPYPNTINDFKYEDTVTVKPIKAKQDIVLNALVDKNNDKIILDWNDIKDIDYYKIWQKKEDQNDFQVMSSNNFAKGEKVKVLNIYPTSSVKDTFKDWVNESGQGLIDIDTVSNSNFNDNPDFYLKNENGEYKYDVIACGFANITTATSLPIESVLSINEAKNNNVGILLGHHYIGENIGNFPKFSEEYFMNKYKNTDEVCSYEVELNKSHEALNYPNKLGEVGDVLKIPHTHSNYNAFPFEDDIVIKFHVPKRHAYPYSCNKNYDGYSGIINGKNVSQNAYLSIHNNVAQIQTGHSGRSITTDEKNMLANTVFYLAQKLSESYLEDINGKDINKPTTPAYELYQTGIKKGLQFNSEDKGSTYEYYVEGVSKFGDVTNISNKKKVEVKSGFKGFSYEVSNNPNPSPNLGDVINSTDGFIPAKELASKLYIHVISSDKAGNKSEIVTLPIAGMFEDLPPTLTVGGNISISRGKDYDLMKNVSAIDDYDGDLTKDINVVIKNPDNKIVDEFDTNILGKWSIEYSVKDSKNQESKIIKEIIVKENLDYLNIKLGEPDKKRFIATFPNASITNNSDKLINGMKLYISEGFNSSITIKYSDKGIEKSFKGQQLILNSSYTTKEAEELIKSIRIEHDNSTSFTFNVRLQNNSVDDIIYNPQNGNYYQFVEAKRITWKNAKERAEKMEYRGLKGHLATIKSKYELDLFNCLTTKTVWLGATDEEEEGKWKWVTGEPVKFTNWCVGEPNNLGGTEDYMSSIKNSGGLWNDTVNSPDPVWTDIEGFVVEFENMDNGSSDGVYRYEDSVKIDNMVSKQDIVLNLENKDDNITLNWNDYKNADYYKVLRKEKDSFEIVKDNLRENILSGYLAEDKAPPKMEYSLILNKERTAKMEFYTEDVGSNYEYKVESYDRDNYQTAYSNIVKTTVTSGFKGYHYVLDENENTEINGEVNNTDGKFEFKNVTDNTYLHIYAVDNNGNKTETKHVKLSDDTYNNKPRITLPGKNRVINIGEEFNKLQGVSAYDFEDGNLTNKIKVEGEVNNNKKGVYKIKYTVEDSKGIQAEEIVQVHVTGDMEINIEEGSNNLEVNWSKVNNAVKYVLYRTNENGFSFEEKGTFTDTQFIDDTAIDISSPAITYLGEINEDSTMTRKVVSLSKEILGELNNKKVDNKENLKLKVISKDLGTTYRYFVEALDKDNNVVNSSEIRNGKVTAGLAGFSYVIDEKENTEVKNSVNIKNAEDIDIKNNKSKFLHIKAIDKNGNVSKAIHHLITGKYDTNYIPVIKGLTSKRVKEGESFNPLVGVTAYDVEDGDITNKIQIIGSVDTNKNGKYQLIYKVEDSQGNIREVKRNILVHGDMEIKVTPNKEDNNVDISWDKNVLGDDVFYEVRKWNSMEGYYTTIGYTEDLSFTDTDTKDIFGPKINGITEIKEEENNIDEENYEEESIDEENFLEYNDLENKNNMDENIDKNMDVLEGNNLNSNKFLRKDINDNTYLKLNIDAVDRGVSETYQVRTRLKEDNTVIRDMTDEEGRDWDVGTDFGGEVEYFKWKLSNKREDNLDTGTIKTSVSKDTIEFNTEDYKYIHFIPYDTYGNAGQLVHYELGEINNEENELIPPTIEGVKNRVIMIDSKFNVLEGIKAYDYAGEDLTGYIKINGFVDVNKTGEYTLNYSVMDFKGQLTEETCNIVVADYNENIPNEKPNKIDNSPIVINYADEVYMKVGNKYDVMSGIKVTDEEDGDLTSKVTYTTNLDTNKVGDYIVNYSIRDSGDNRVRWNRVVHVIPNNIDCPETGEPSPDWEGNGAFPQIYAYPTYIAVGSEFNPYDSIIVYDEEDGYITNKLKFSGYVNTLKPGIYYLTYKVTDSDGNTSYCGRSVYVYEGNWGNPDGEKPKPNPDWGENDNEDEDNDHIPPKPNQPDQDEEGLPPSNLPNIDKDQDGDGQKDIYIDKNGNVVKPDGSIETPGGIIVKPSEDGKVPSIDGEGNIVVPPNGIIIKSDGNIETPKNGAIIRPNGNIEIQQQYKQDDEENNKYIYRDNPDNEERNGINNNSEEYNNNESNEDNESNDENNPSTGDKGIFIFVSLIMASLVGLFINRKKK